MTDLCRLAQKYGTDKYPWYTPFYDSLLRDRRDSVRRVLEIGIGTPEAMSHVPDYKPGASLRMWRDYFPNAEIFGIDIEPSVLFSEDRIVTTTGTVHGLFDLIIDDASHDPLDQVVNADEYVPFLTGSGLHIIEDVNGELPIPFPHQYVECHVPDSDKVGRCIVIRA